jgi:hypothetical protein
LSDPKPHVDASQIVTADDAIKALNRSHLDAVFKLTPEQGQSSEFLAYVHREQAMGLGRAIEAAETKIERETISGATQTMLRASVVVLHPQEAKAIAAVLKAYAFRDRQGDIPGLVKGWEVAAAGLDLDYHDQAACRAAGDRLAVALMAPMLAAAIEAAQHGRDEGQPT